MNITESNFIYYYNAETITQFNLREPTPYRQSSTSTLGQQLSQVTTSLTSPSGQLIFHVQIREILALLMHIPELHAIGSQVSGLSANCYPRYIPELSHNRYLGYYLYCLPIVISGKNLTISLVKPRTHKQKLIS